MGMVWSRVLKGPSCDKLSPFSMNMHVEWFAPCLDSAKAQWELLSIPTLEAVTIFAASSAVVSKIGKDLWRSIGDGIEVLRTLSLKDGSRGFGGKEGQICTLQVPQAF